MWLGRRKTRLVPASPGNNRSRGRMSSRRRPLVVPTETIYGLAADATSDAAVAGIFAAKGRPAFNPLIAHVLDVGRRGDIRHSGGPPSGWRKRSGPDR